MNSCFFTTKSSATRTVNHRNLDYMSPLIEVPEFPSLTTVNHRQCTDDDDEVLLDEKGKKKDVSLIKSVKEAIWGFRKIKESGTRSQGGSGQHKAAHIAVQGWGATGCVQAMRPLGNSPLNSYLTSLSWSQKPLSCAGVLFVCFLNKLEVIKNSFTLWHNVNAIRTNNWSFIWLPWWLMLPLESPCVVCLVPDGEWTPNQNPNSCDAQ